MSHVAFDDVLGSSEFTSGASVWMHCPWLSMLFFAQIEKRWMPYCLGLRERMDRWPKPSATVGNS